MISLKSLHTFGLDSFASKLVCLEHSDDLPAILAQMKQAPFWILGEGSNSIFIENFEGLVIRVMNRGITVREEDDVVHLTVQAGENWHGLVCWCLEQGFYGFENLALIPGTVGAAPIQNIGAYGVEVDRFISAVECVDIATGDTFTLSPGECQFGYRDSVFKGTLLDKVLIRSVSFALPRAWQAVQHYGELQQLVNPDARQIFDKVVEIRRSKLPDPAVIGNAGSFFKNPIIPSALFSALKAKYPDIPGYPQADGGVKLPAAWLIDTLGFKGKQMAGIGCHPRQALVLTNNGEGNGERLLSLAREIRDKVNMEFDVELENEVRLIGRQGVITL